MGILVEGTTHVNVATKSNLDAWIGAAKTPHTWTLDGVAPQATMQVYFGKPRETYFIIDLKTMKILEIINNDVSTAMSNLAARL
ncbi:MAG: hypothetical protein EXR72_16790 [Myxococcales bacterium]|nr:hypothetical protein [Myxococcales bacterium]